MSQNESHVSDRPLTDVPGEDAEATPFDRQRAFLSQRHAVMRPTEGEGPEGGVVAPFAAGGADLDFGAAAAPDGSVSPVTAHDFSLTLPADFQQRVMMSYRARQRGEVPAAAPLPPGVAADAPLPAPANNWVALGPSVVSQGQAVTRPAVSGRIAGLAIAPGGLRVYVASANGGVWRSDDGGRTWRSTMDAWDLNPQTHRSNSLSCGAIAIDVNDPDRVYVGTGEGGANAYFGVGPIRSDDGANNGNWIQEYTSTPESSLAGRAFYALAVDPADRERAVGATDFGLYRREPRAGGGYHWVRKEEGVFTSVVVARGGGVTTFYAAQSGGDVLKSTDGNAWTPAGSDFPNDDTYRIALAVQPRNPNVVYALVGRGVGADWRRGFHVRGVWRLDRGPDRWREVTGWPADLFGSDPTRQGQGSGR